MEYGLWTSTVVYDMLLQKYNTGVPPHGTLGTVGRMMRYVDRCHSTQVHKYFRFDSTLVDAMMSFKFYPMIQGMRIDI